MPITRAQTWTALAARQDGVLARRQLLSLGFDAGYVEAQVRARRWQRLGDVVVCTTTGPLSRRQRMWAGVLHAGRISAIGGLTALELRGLDRWTREDVTVLLPKSRNLQSLQGVRFVETRRPVSWYVSALNGLPVWRTEPAALLHAAYEPVTRSAYGLLAAVVQQGLTTPGRLDAWVTRMRPLRRAKAFRRVLGQIAGGVQSLAELDVARMCHEHRLPLPLRQVRRRDGAGRARYTDAEWHLPSGRVVVLEVDGGFHMAAEHWQADVARERDLVATGLIVVRCTATELRGETGSIARALRRLGVGESSA